MSSYYYSTIIYCCRFCYTKVTTEKAKNNRSNMYRRDSHFCISCTITILAQCNINNPVIQMQWRFSNPSSLFFNYRKIVFPHAKIPLGPNFAADINFAQPRTRPNMQIFMRWPHNAIMAHQKKINLVITKIPGRKR